MSRLAIVLRIGLATGGFAFATSNLAVAGNAKGGSIETVAPVSGTTPDIVAVGPADGANGGAFATPEKFRAVSPSIIAAIGLAAEASQKPEESLKKTRFDPEPLVIRAGMIGAAAPIKVSATRDERPETNGQILPPESGDKPARAEDQKKPIAAPE